MATPKKTPRKRTKPTPPPEVIFQTRKELDDYLERIFNERSVVNRGGQSTTNVASPPQSKIAELARLIEDDNNAIIRSRYDLAEAERVVTETKSRLNSFMMNRLDRLRQFDRVSRIPESIV